MRDRFIIGQENRALRRHLDSVGPNTPISDIVNRCHVWESYDEINSRPIASPEPTGPRGVFQVTQWASDEQNDTLTKLTQPRRNTKYLPTGYARWHNSWCRGILT